MRLIDADALERDGWRMSRIVQVDEKTMEAQTRKPTDFPTIEPQPEPCEDTISRQSAIQAADCIVDHHAITPYQTMRSAMDHLQRILRGMPSAQPEIVRCKDCRYRKFVDFGMGDCLHPSGCRGIAFDNHFCALGERREDQDE